MAKVDVNVPQLSESVAEATLLQWKKKPGDAVAMDEILIEVETDKVVLEVPAPAAGVLAEVIRPDGSTVAAGELIARIDSRGESGSRCAGCLAGVESGRACARSRPRSCSGSQGRHRNARGCQADGDKGISPGQVTGSGKDGRITRATCWRLPREAAAGCGAEAAPVAARPALPQVQAPVDLSMLAGRPSRGCRCRACARASREAGAVAVDAAILTTFNEVNMQPVMDMRNRYKDRFEKEHGAKLGFMSFFVKAAVAALKKYPVVNASVDGNDIVYHGYFDIGIAVGSPRGLVVPILREATR